MENGFLWFLDSQLRITLGAKAGLVGLLGFQHSCTQRRVTSKDRWVADTSHKNASMAWFSWENLNRKPSIFPLLYGVFR